MQNRNKQPVAPMKFQQYFDVFRKLMKSKERITIRAARQSYDRLIEKLDGQSPDLVRHQLEISQLLAGRPFLLTYITVLPSGELETKQYKKLRSMLRNMDQVRGDTTQNLIDFNYLLAELNRLKEVIRFEQGEYDAIKNKIEKEKQSLRASCDILATNLEKPCGFHHLAGDLFKIFEKGLQDFSLQQQQLLDRLAQLKYTTDIPLTLISILEKDIQERESELANTTSKMEEYLQQQKNIKLAYIGDRPLQVDMIIMALITFREIVQRELSLLKEFHISLSALLPVAVEMKVEIPPPFFAPKCDVHAKTKKAPPAIIQTASPPTVTVVNVAKETLLAPLQAPSSFKERLKFFKELEAKSQAASAQPSRLSKNNIGIKNQT